MFRYNSYCSASDISRENLMPECLRRAAQTSNSKDECMLRLKDTCKLCGLPRVATHATGPHSFLCFFLRFCLFDAPPSLAALVHACFARKDLLHHPQRPYVSDGTGSEITGSVITGCEVATENREPSFVFSSLLRW